VLYVGVVVPVRQDGKPSKAKPHWTEFHPWDEIGTIIIDLAEYQVVNDK
jgi:hypothetical protein